MDLDALRLVTRIDDSGSLSEAARHLGISRSSASQRLHTLEVELGAKLFQRTTRAIAPTTDGRHFIERARKVLADVDELASQFTGAKNLRGRVRADVPTGIARNLVIPRLAELLQVHPRLEVELSTSDRRVDPLREGFDCVLRIGGLGPPSLTFQMLGLLPMVTCASPTYVQRHGLPRTPDELAHHLVVHYAQSLGEGRPSLELLAGDLVVDHPMRHLLAVSGTDAYRAAGLAGFGLIQVPRFSAQAELASGALIEVLADHSAPPMQVAIVHPHGRSVPRRVRAFMVWLAALLEPYLQRPPGRRATP